MSIKMSTGLANAILDTGSVKSTLTDGLIHIYEGTVPDSADDSVEGHTLLCTVSDDGTGTGLAFETQATDGVLLKLSSQSWAGTNLATGTASFFRFVAPGDTGVSSTTEKRIQGRIAVVGSDMQLASTSLVETETQVIDNFAIAVPV